MGRTNRDKSRAPWKKVIEWVEHRKGVFNAHTKTIFSQAAHTVGLTILSLTAQSQCVPTGVIHMQGAYPTAGEVYRPPTGSWMPGDVVKIVPTNLSVLEIYGGGGTECQPIDIIANTYFHATFIRFKGGAHHYRIISSGSGSDTTTYRTITANNIAMDGAHHISVIGAEIYGSNVGIYNKQNVDFNDPSTWFPTAYQPSNKIIGNWIHDIDGEGIYAGLTLENGYSGTSPYTGNDTVIIGSKIDSTEIAYNYISRCTWDGAQVASARLGNKIHHNVIRDFGTLNISGQQTGITLGGESSGDVYNNTITKGTGTAIALYGYGTVNVYSNTIDSTGTTNLAPEPSIYAVHHTITYRVVPPLQLNIYDNHINHPRSYSKAIKNSTNGNEIASTVVNNTFCIPGAAENWQDTYLILDVPGTTNTNNTLYCETSCNCVITNILRSGKYIN